MKNAVFLLLCMFFLASCATTEVKRTELKKEPFECSVKSDITTVMGTGSILVEGSSIKGRAVIYAKRPDKIRIEVYGPMKRIIAVFAGTAKSCAFYDAENGLGDCYEGTGVLGSIEPELLTALLTGDHAGALFSSDGIIVEKDSMGRVEVLKKSGGMPGEFKLDVSGYGKFNCAYLPSRISIERDGFSATVDITSYKINTEIKDSAFKIE